MCEFNDKIKTLLFSDLDEDDKVRMIAEETDKEVVLDYLDNNELGISLEELGLTEEDLLNAHKYDIDDSDNINFSDDDVVDMTFKIIKLYRYSSDYYGPIGVGPNTRRFCLTLVNRTKLSLMRKEDIERLNGANPGFGKGGSNNYSVFNWRGGVNCYHKWEKYFYDPDTKNLVVAPNNEQPTQTTRGNRVPYANGTNKPTKNKK
jgi:hypothetical protein